MKRIQVFDYLRGFAVFAMVMQHAMLVYAPQDSENHWVGLFFLLLGTAPAAPVFMIIMGYLASQSQQQSMLALIKRGLSLIALGYLLNAVRFPLLWMDKNTAIGLLLEVDIFQLAGLSMILMAPLRRWVKKPWLLLFLAASLFIVSPFLWGRDPKIRFFDLLWGAGEFVSFPFFPWGAYPIIGLAFGLWMKGQDKFPIVYMLLSAPFLCLAAAAGWNFFPKGDYFRSGFSIHLLILGFIVLWFCFWHYVDQIISKENKLLRLLTFWSHSLTRAYIIQWILIGWSLLFIGDGQYDSITAAFIGFAVLILTYSILSLR